MRKQERVGIPISFKGSVIRERQWSVTFNDHRIGLPRVLAADISQVGDKITLIKISAIGQIGG